MHAMVRIWKSGNDLLFCIQLDACEMSQRWLWYLARVNSKHYADLHALHQNNVIQFTNVIAAHSTFPAQTRYPRI